STSMSASTRMFASGRPSRSPRRRTCSAASSPLTYSTGRPRAARPDANWIASVDLPTPGSPPTSTAEPATRPPPRTRSSSPMPVGVLSPPASPSTPASGSSAAELADPRIAAALRDVGETSRRLASSASEFHLPHAGHLPSHLVWRCPHSWQTYSVSGFARLAMFPVNHHAAGDARQRCDDQSGSPANGEVHMLSYICRRL